MKIQEFQKQTSELLNKIDKSLIVKNTSEEITDCMMSNNYNICLQMAIFNNQKLKLMFNTK